VSIIDIADPAKPKIIVNLPLMNTITGPPVNLRTGMAGRGYPTTRSTSSI